MEDVDYWRGRCEKAEKDRDEARTKALQDAWRELLNSRVGDAMIDEIISNAAQRVHSLIARAAVAWRDRFDETGAHVGTGQLLDAILGGEGPAK
jgi:hypothetical protein